MSTALTELLELPVQEQFPGLRPGIARFDGPGGTLVHAAVCDAVATYLGSEHVANDHGAFPASRHSDELVDWSVGRIRALLTAPRGQVVFGPNMTTLTTMFLRTIENGLHPGDEIVCTELDHEANIAPWQALGARRGAKVRLARLTGPGLLPTVAVDEQLTDRTRWVAVTAASNALGTTPDLQAICNTAHRVGARVFVDGVQAVAHCSVDVDAWGCDAFVTSAYKWYGPHAGVLWLRDSVAQEARLLEQVSSAGNELPARLQLGTTNFEAVLGTGIAADVLLHADRKLIAKQERGLTEQLLAGLAANSAVRLLGVPTADGRTPVISFQVDGQRPEVVAARLADAGVYVWHGTFYAANAMRALSPGDPDAVRAGIAWYTTETDVQQLLGALAAITGQAG